MDNHTDKKRDRLITLPADVSDIKYALPMTDCKVCEYKECINLALKIRDDHSLVSKCPYMESKLYWLEPRSDCNECGYDTCLEFTKAVNKGKAFVFSCPYAYGEDKKASNTPPKSAKPSNVVRYKDRLITLPADVSDIKYALPMTDCKVCEYKECINLALKIRDDHSLVSKCPYMESKLYWLEPRSDCNECGYDTCLEFTKAVNKGKAFVFSCPYAYGEDKKASNTPPKSAKPSNVVRYKDRLITLPADVSDIKYALPMTDCKVCEYKECINLALKIRDDHSLVSKCPYMESKLYWLEPRSDCNECGYDTCLEFTKAVNKGKAFVFSCPYAYGEDKPNKNKVQIKINTKEIKPSKEIRGIEKVIKLFTKNLDIKVNVKEVGHLPTDEQPRKEEPKRPILNTKYDETLTSQEKEKFFKKQLEKANDLIKDKKISTDLELIIQNNTDIYEMAHKHPSLEKQINKFSSTYLPMTLELLNEYLMLESKAMHEESSKEQKKKIAKSIAKAKAAFIKLNDDLFRQISYDIDAQIKAFDDILTIDGLLSDDDFKIDRDDDKKEDR